MKLPVKTLKAYHRNPRRGNVDLIAESLTEFGQYRSIVVNEGTHTGRANEVLVGNHTLQAAKQLGWTEVDCKVIDVDDATAARIVLADNRTSDLGTYDDEGLLELLESLDSLTGTGFTDDDVEDLIVAIEAPVVLEDVEPDRFAESSMRAMYVTFTIEEYAEVQMKLQELMQQMGLPSNAAVIAALVKESAGAL